MCSSDLWSGQLIGWLAVLVAGTAAFASIGLAVAFVSTTVRSANRLANLLLIPMMALGGIALPASMLPDSIAAVRGLLPVAPLQDGIYGALVYGETLADQAPRLAALLAWTGIACGAAAMAWRRRVIR